jgi:hypothetical protein
MRDRPIGVATLATGTAAAALYCQLAGVALLLSGSIFGTASSVQTMATLAVGAIFFALSLAAFLLGHAFWVGKSWSWSVGTTVYAALLGASVLLAMLSTRPASALVPSIVALVAIWYLHRPTTRAALDGVARRTEAAAPASAKLEGARPAH